MQELLPAVAVIVLEAASVSPRVRQRYSCRDCGHSDLLPEHPRHGPLTVRKGCPNCGRIRTYSADGRVAF